MEIEKLFRNSIERGIFQSVDDDERRAQRKPMSDDKLAALLKADKEGRLRYLYNEVLGQEEVWTAFDSSDYLAGWWDAKNNSDLAPIWPQKEFAEAFIVDQNVDWTVVPIPLVDWIDVITPNLMADKCRVSIFPVSGDITTVIDPEQMLDEWENEWKKYAKYQLRNQTFNELSRAVTTKKVPK